jgi:hypothetical protein
MKIRHGITHAIPPIIQHNNIYGMMLDNVFVPYTHIMQQQFIVHPQILYDDETDELCDVLTSERIEKLLQLEPFYEMNLTSDTDE